jgi:hypothetical protein
MVAGQECPFKLNRGAEIYGNKVAAGRPGSGLATRTKSQSGYKRRHLALFPNCNVGSTELCASLDTVLRPGYSSATMKIINFERDNSTEFSNLYVHLLKAALDEMHPSLSPEVRERNLAAHVAWGISMTGFVSGVPCGASPGSN